MTIAISGNKHRTCYRTGVAIEYNITYFIPEGGQDGKGDMDS
ncbi:hypothetical protein ACFLXA_05580 [Chloroflexota bacterium]